MTDENARSTTFTEKLVAYLDGELPETEVRDVEQTLANDPAARAEAEKLNRAWELLDVLQQPRASDEFTQRTLSTLKAADPNGDLAATTALAAAARRSANVWTVASWSVALLVVGVLSFITAQRLSPPPADPLIDDLTLIENLDVYAEVGDVRFLQELQQRGFFDEPVEKP